MWLLQSNPVTESLLRMAEALNAQGIPFKQVDFNTPGLRLSHADARLPYYGSVRLETLVQKHTKVDQRKFAPSVYGVYRHSHLLNRTSTTLPATRVLDQWITISNSPVLHIRPDTGHKLFNGGVYDKNEFRAIVRRLKDPTQLVSVSKTKLLSGEEYRAFIVDHQVVSVSGYSAKRGVAIPPVTLAVLEAFEALTEGWLPYPNCVMDICLYLNKYRIIEFNPLNTSALYRDHDPHLIVTAVTNSPYQRFLSTRTEDTQHGPTTPGGESSSP